MPGRIVCLLLALVLSACMATGSVKRVPQADLAAEPYRLDSGDRLRVVVFGQADLSNSFAVDQGGHIAMPLVGTIPARGATTQELAGRIAAALRGGFLRDPDVSVEIEQYRPFFIMGEVRAPGQYVYVAGMTAQTAVAIAGGFTPRASEGDAEITRAIDGEVMRGRVALTAPIRPGDTIRIRQRLF